MIKITMLFNNGVWDAETKPERNGNADACKALSITNSLAPGVPDGQTPRMSDMTYIEVADFVFANAAEVQQVFVTLEDTIFHASRFDGGSVRVFSADRFSGKRANGSATNEKLGAILYLALAGDDAPRSEDLYPLAESVVETWPNECRPMP
jgi:hypothetical protein